jgi:hypothetical protein
MGHNELVCFRFVAFHPGKIHMVVAAVDADEHAVVPVGIVLPQTLFVPDDAGNPMLDDIGSVGGEGRDLLQLGPGSIAGIGMQQLEGQLVCLDRLGQRETLHGGLL